MKLRAITLENVRRFGGQRAALSGIGDGLTVVSEANEFGKSTFFDALHALFFQRHSGAAGAVKSLQPHAGGAVRISAEIDLPDGSYRLSKTYLSKKSAQVIRLPEGTVIARGGEADDWIEALMARSGGGVGPTGLLWVRQGVVGLDVKDSAQKAARRDLLSSVAGEIEELTGGRSMDRIQRRAEAALAEIATPGQGRPKGPRKVVEDALATAREALEETTRDCSDLSQALSDRRRALAERARLSDPAVTARQAQALSDAQAAHDAARAHARLQEAAQRNLQVAQLTHRAALDRRAQRDATQQEAARAAAGLAAARSAQQVAQTAAEDAAAGLKAAKSAAQTAEAALQQAGADLTAAQQAEGRARAGQEAERLAALLVEVDGHLQEARTLQTAADANPATPDRLAEAEEAVRARDTLQARVTAGAVHLTMQYDGSAQVSVNGTALPDGTPIPLTRTAALDLPGLGRLQIDLPGLGDLPSPEDIALSERRVAEALAAMQVADIHAARAATAARDAHMRDAKMARQLAQTLAPQGRDVLHEALEQARAALGEVAPPQDPRPLAEVAATRDLAEAEAQAARSALDVARTANERAQAELSAEGARLAAQQAAFERAEDAAGPPEAREAARAALQTEVDKTAQAVAQAQDTLDALDSDAPDPATAEADLRRAEAMIRNGRERLAALDRDIAGYEARITLRADTGVEERRAELAEEVSRLEARAQAYTEEVAGLQHLVAALRDARAAARDVYFGPVQAELRPLLQLLHDDADLHWEDDAMLPGNLQRAGISEAFGTLSGGTQEQIAILTRLAFARLSARSGQHLPVILDDALVYSDDDRIVKMFTALNRVAMNQQVIVFSCRQMAFNELGGARPRVDITSAEPPA